MPQQYPKKLPPKGKGRVDNKHQIALLTDFEVAALNTLKNRDRDRGFSSGSGPEIKALAKQNSRPFEFVNYRGERIPSLNDFSEGGYGGGGDAGSDAGEQEARDQTSSGGDYGGSNDWAARERRRKEKEAADKAAAEKLHREKIAKEKKKAKDIKAIHAYLAELASRRQSTYTGEDPEEGEGTSLSGYRAGDTPMDPGEFDPRSGETPLDAGEFGTTTTTKTKKKDDDDDDDDDDDGGLTEEEFNALLEEHDIETFTDSEGGIHLSQEEADLANVGYGKTAKIGTAEGFGYGTEVAGTDEEGNALVDEEGNVITEDKSLTGGYKSAYEQLLADAYDAADRGVGSGIMASGGLPTYDDAGVEVDPYAALESAAAGQSTYLDTLAANYQTEAQGRYDDWLSTNTAAINELTSLSDIQDYTWTDMPEYDTDFSGGVNPDTGEWDEDWMPEFYSGFNKEYGNNYLAPDSWEYDDEGNIVPGSYNSATTGTADTTVEEDDGSALAPSAKMAPGIQPGKKGATGVAQYGRSAARYI